MKIKYLDRKTKEIKVENPPSEGLIKFLYNNPIGKLAILPLAKRKFITTCYSKRLDKPKSKSKIKPFIDSLNIDMNESAKKTSDFTTFNDFFYRKLKPESRPIEEGMVSPGDGRLLAFENVKDLSKHFIKGCKFTLKEFLGSDKLARKYKDSSLIILRLAPNDYHRYHFPYGGKVVKHEKIKGFYYSVSPIALVKNFTRVFCENKRELCELKTEDKGDILIIPVGATMVGSMISTYDSTKEIKKGDEMGYFKFGGSTVVLLIDKSKISIDKDLLENTSKNIETYVKMGEKIAL